METHELILNNQKIIIMEQPTKYILELEKKYTDQDLIGYAEEILKYPADVNPTIEEIVNIPDVIKYKELKLNLVDEKTGKKNLLIAQNLFLSFKENKLNPAYVGEKYLEYLNKSVDDYKYKEVSDIGTEVLKQVGGMLKLVAIIEMFRNC